MGNPRGVRRDFEALEKRRRAAVRLVVEQGWSQSAAARQVKAAQQSVSRWVAEYRRRGWERLDFGPVFDYENTPIRWGRIRLKLPQGEPRPFTVYTPAILHYSRLS